MSAAWQIFKYPLDPSLGGQHAIPAGSRFLSLQVQTGVPVMWWDVPVKSEEWPLRTFSVVPTGPPGHDGDLYYLGTFQIGGFVGHVMSWEPL